MNGGASKREEALINKDLDDSDEDDKKKGKKTFVFSISEATIFF